MKEAAGEANMTVITIILIGVIAAVAIPLVRNAMSGVSKQACCNSAGGVWASGNCSGHDEATYNACVAGDIPSTEQ